jgi:hypothetical protein
MTKLLEEAIAEIRKLPDAEQDRAAELLLALAWPAADGYELTPEQEERIRLGLSQARRGEFTDPAVIEDIWRRFDL